LLTLSTNSYLLWNPKVHYLVHKSPLSGSCSFPVESSPQLHILSKLYFNIILPSTTGSSNLSIPSRCFDHNFVFGVKHKLWSSSLCNFLHSCYFLFLGSKYSPQLHILKYSKSLFFQILKNIFNNYFLFSSLHTVLYLKENRYIWLVVFKMSYLLKA